MSDGSATRGLRERLASGTEDRLGRALGDLLENPLLNGALGRASDAREKAAQAQELAMGALNLPSAADIERLTRRLRSVSQRLEGIEDGVHRLGRALPTQSVEMRLTAIEEQLRTLSRTLAEIRQGSAAARSGGAGEGPARAEAAPRRPAAKPKRAATKPPSAAKGGAAKGPGTGKGPGAAKGPGAGKGPGAVKRVKPAAR